MRNVIVSGGSRGIGLAIGRRLAQDGYRVIAIARRESEELRAEIQRLEGSLAFVPFDFNDVHEVPALVIRLKKEFGPPYGLVNNAALGTEGALGVMHNAQIEELTRVNMLAPILLTKYVARNIMAAGVGGRIVNIASIIASTGYSGLGLWRHKGCDGRFYKITGSRSGEDRNNRQRRRSGLHRHGNDVHAQRGRKSENCSPRRAQSPCGGR